MIRIDKVTGLIVCFSIVVFAELTSFGPFGENIIGVLLDKTDLGIILG